MLSIFSLIKKYKKKKGKTPYEKNISVKPYIGSNSYIFIYNETEEDIVTFARFTKFVKDFIVQKPHNFIILHDCGLFTDEDVVYNFKKILSKSKVITVLSRDGYNYYT